MLRGEDRRGKKKYADIVYIANIAITAFYFCNNNLTTKQYSCRSRDI